MRLVTTCEHRFERLHEGSVWTADAFPYEYWQPYLDVFDEVRVVARVRDSLLVSRRASECHGAVTGARHRRVPPPGRTEAMLDT